MTEVQYLPEPPATVEAGPNIAAPSPDNTWLPGCWMWQNGRYAWRPGFWAAVQPDWDWVPAHYVYAPRGYVFVDGYWDYSIGRRGVLFAPVYFDAGVYTQPGFSYSPATVIDLGVFANNLFLRPQYQHYYFGDYYAANYQAAGFYPSYSYNSGRYGYDPIFAHERWEHRQDGQWEHRVAADFQNRRDHEDARPPRTWAAQNALGGGGVRSRERSPALAAPSPNSQRAQTVRCDSSRSTRQRDKDWVSMGKRCSDSARSGKSWKPEWRRPQSSSPRSNSRRPRVPLPRSPIVARSVTGLGKGHAPPQMHDAPKAGSQGRAQAESESVRSAAAATYGEPAAARHGATAAATQPQPQPQLTAATATSRARIGRPNRQGQQSRFLTCSA